MRRFLLLPAPAAPGSSRTDGVLGWLTAAHFALVLAVLAFVFVAAFQHLQHPWNWEAPWRYRTLFWKGWLTTVGLASAALVLSTLIGATAALASECAFLPARAASRLYVEIIRGTPFLVQILVFFYVLAPVFRLENRYLAGTLALSLFSGAYITEIIRAGLASIPASQWESARSLGLTTAQTYRLVVAPQALRVTLPPLAGQFVSLVKDSSLLSVIGVAEFALNAQQVSALTYGTLESYLPLAAGYLLLTLPISLWARALERRIRFDS